MAVDLLGIKRALISVSDKEGLEPLARKLHDQGVEIISSGGTGAFLTGIGLPFTPIESVTGNPECFGGRMKTLSFQVSSALLYRRDHAEDAAQAEKMGIRPIDMVVCNLYPFEATVKRGAAWPELVENIDIGGPTLIRAAAKNHEAVAVVTDPLQYATVLQTLGKNKGALTAALRERLALEAFRLTARYDAQVAAQFEERAGMEARTLVLTPHNANELRYGENPHQKSWIYKDNLHPGLASAVPLQGKELSYNNLLDADAAWRCCGDMATLRTGKRPAAVAIIKHLTPCGAALASTPLEALTLAWSGDPVSSFGGIVAFNKEVGVDIAEWLSERFVEVIVAPSFTPEALAVFSRKKNLRLIALPPYDGFDKFPVVRSVSGGWVVQQEDNGIDLSFSLVTGAAFPSGLSDIARFGIMACKHLKSNAIGIFSATDEGYYMIGAGMGNPNRLISMRQAVDKARENGHHDLSDAVLVSDAFFPFADNIDVARAAGIRYIIQPGGSLRDKEVITACNDAQIAMFFTGRRHFRH
jgi:phosphoribosylaminoimidazolecarboxamide formyltransferase/IMP cyclohydrolase